MREEAVKEADGQVDGRRICHAEELVRGDQPGYHFAAHVRIDAAFLLALLDVAWPWSCSRLQTSLEVNVACISMNSRISRM